jgi:hypothetical protein
MLMLAAVLMPVAMLFMAVALALVVRVSLVMRWVVEVETFADFMVLFVVLF